MTYKKYNLANNAKCQLDSPIDNNDLVFIAKGNYNLFPTANFIIRITHFDTDWTVLGRENMLIDTRVADTFTINASGRAYENVPLDDSATTQTQQALPFYEDDLIEAVVSGEIIKDVQDKVQDLNDTKLNIADFQKGITIYEASGTASDAYAITPDPAISAYLNGMMFKFLTDVANNGPATFSVSGLTAYPIYKLRDQTLATWDLEAWQVVTVSFYNNTWQMDSQLASLPTVDIESLTEDTDPDGDEWDITSKAWAQKKVRWSTRWWMPKSPALGAISAWSPVYITAAWSAVTIASTVRNASINIGYDSGNAKAAQAIAIPVWAKSISSIDLYLYKNGSPVGNLVVKVYASDQTTVLATSSSVAESSLSGGGSGNLVTFNFANEFVLEWETVYFVLECDRANSTSNFTYCDYHSASGTYTGDVAYYISSAWVYTSLGWNSDLKFSLVFWAVGWYIGKASNLSGFSGILKKATAALNDVGNIQTFWNAKISSLWNETDTISSTADISQTTSNDAYAITVYSGQSERSHRFFTGPNVANLSSWSVSISQNGTGGGILTANVYAASSTGDNMVKTGASLGSAVINSPTGWVNTFTPASAIVLEPNTWYIISYTSASGNVSNYWGLASQNTGMANLWTDWARCGYYTGTWAWNGAPYLITYYTSRRNYSKWDFIYLSPTAGTFETYRKYRPYPIGRIIDSTNILLEKYGGSLYIGYAEIPINSTYPRGHLPIPKNCTRMRIEMLVSGGTPNYTYLELRITDFDNVDKSYSLYSGGALSFTLWLGRNWIRAYGQSTGTLKVYFYQ